ncbi:MAG TPA: hypothetical protein PLU49_14525 [Saprospiraceae bacterium]|nr:hypothetical protein [Saprospiraceae bacterium]
MKKMRLILMGAAFLSMGTYLSAQTFTAHHENRHRGRDEFGWYVEKGIRSGELTDREVRKLRIEWNELEHLKRHAYHNGRISRREERRIWEEEKEFEKMLHVFLNNREREHYRKYEKRHHDDRYYRDGDRDRYNRYDRH